MSTALTTTNFHFDTTQLRTLMIDRRPWFIAKDVCQNLGYTHTPHAMRLLDKDEKAVRVVDTPGGAQRSTVISEAGVYKLIMNSRRPEARQFDRWVRQTVLPALRMDGMYVVGEEGVVTGELSGDEFIDLVMERLRAKIERRRAERIGDQVKVVEMDSEMAALGRQIVQLEISEATIG